MPTYQGQISEDQIAQIVAYLKSLNAAEGAQGGQPGGASQGH
jgi:mono/diheme cytochrome c family protein